jgi:NTP pyrophosphatase (non-canonical NTP hydrolase)
MEFSNYQNQSKRTAVYPGEYSNTGLMYVALGLCGESGEIANNVKKLIRDSNGEMSAERHDLLVKELGDVLWYLAMLCYELDTTLETVALRNLAKLRKRQRDNALQGSGDDR